MVKNQRKVIVAYRVVPGEPENCVVVTTENLDSADHDVLMKTVESDAGQQADEFAEVMTRTRLSDGRNMLAAFHTTGKMVKVPTEAVELTPDTRNVINLAELNNIIAEQKGVTVGDLAMRSTPAKSAKPEGNVDAVAQYTGGATETSPTNEGVLTDTDMAKQYRSQADRLSKEAAELRRQAEALVPTKKKTKTKESA